jgi:hypothetical protein
VPSEFLDALMIGGRLVLPLTPNERPGCMLLLRANHRPLSPRTFSLRLRSSPASAPVTMRNRKHWRLVAGDRTMMLIGLL